MQVDRLSLVVLALAGSAAGHAAVPDANLPAVAPPTATAPADKMVCKRQEVIGSLTQRKRVCMTAREWTLREKNAQDELQDMSRPGASTAR